MKLIAQQAEEDNITPFAIKVGALSSQYMLELIKTTPSFQGPGGEVHALPFEISIEFPSFLITIPYPPFPGFPLDEPSV